MDRERMLGVRDRIDRKIMEQIHPKDLFYQILDGLRSLTRYDHSSALFIRENGDDALQLIAEQIAWTKAKSQQIGLRIPFVSDVRLMLDSGQILYTDGASEARAGDADSGEQRIRAAIEQHVGGGAPLLDAILADLLYHFGSRPPIDDVTLLTARVLGGTP
jgi:hypothetical protein